MLALEAGRYFAIISTAVKLALLEVASFWSVTLERKRHRFPLERD